MNKEVSVIGYKDASVNDWDSLTSREELYKVFNEYYESQGLRLNYLSDLARDPEANYYFSDKEIEELVKEFKAAAKPLKPVLEKILNRLPNPATSYMPYDFTERAKGRLDSIRPETQDGFGTYTAILLAALDDKNEFGSFAKFLSMSFHISQLRAARRAYKRFSKFKEDELARRREFEKSSDYKMQKLEIAAGIRKEIEYPEE